jgi:hypothetical protein
MTLTETYRSIPGILRPYKDYISSLGLEPGDQIVYYGCVGTCTPFIELLAVSVRSLPFEQVFVPLLEETKAKRILNVEDIGMQVSGGPVAVRPSVIVIMGGLAMPYMPVTKEQVCALTQSYGKVPLVGVCFMSMFEKAGWLDTVRFDLMIDATLDPVVVTRA